MRDQKYQSRFFAQFDLLPRDYKWKDVLAIINGKAYGEEYQEEGKYPICGSAGVMGYGNKKLCEHDTIILGRKGNIDKPIYMNEDYWIVDTAFCLLPKKDIIHPVYLYYWCKQFDFQKLNKQAVLPSLTRSDLEQIEIQVPKMEDQMLFVKVVQQADKSKFNGFKSRFIEMFGNAEKTKPLSDCIGTTFPGEWGEDDFDGTGVNVIRTTNFTNSGKLDLTNVVTRKIDQAKIDKKHLVPGDIILERSGGTADNPVGRVVYFEATGTFLFNNFTQLLRCKDGVNSLFVFYSLFNYYHTHKSEIRSMGNKTTGIQNLKMDKYWDIPIADASHEQQEQFVCLYKQADKSKYLS